MTPTDPVTAELQRMHADLRGSAYTAIESRATTGERLRVVVGPRAEIYMTVWTTRPAEDHGVQLVDGRRVTWRTITAASMALKAAGWE